MHRAFGLGDRAPAQLADIVIFKESVLEQSGSHAVTRRMRYVAKGQSSAVAAIHSAPRPASAEASLCRSQSLPEPNSTEQTDSTSGVSFAGQASPRAGSLIIRR